MQVLWTGCRLGTGATCAPPGETSWCPCVEGTPPHRRPTDGLSKKKNIAREARSAGRGAGSAARPRSRILLLLLLLLVLVIVLLLLLLVIV